MNKYKIHIGGKEVPVRARSASDAMQAALEKHPGCLVTKCFLGTIDDTGHDEHREITWGRKKFQRTVYVGGWIEFEVPPPSAVCAQE